MKQTRYCPYCGTMIQNDDRFCPYCGRKLPSMEHQKRSFPIALVVIPVVLVVGIFLIFLLFHERKTNNELPPVLSHETSPEPEETSEPEMVQEEVPEVSSEADRMEHLGLLIDLYDRKLLEERRREYEERGLSGEQKMSYALIDVNQDGYPELYIDYGIHAFGSEVCAVVEGKLACQAILNNLNTLFLPEEHLFLDSNGFAGGGITEKIYRLENDGFALAAEGQFQIGGDEPSDCVFDGKEVSWEEYESAFSHVFDREKAVSAEMKQTGNDVLLHDLIETYSSLYLKETAAPEPFLIEDYYWYYLGQQKELFSFERDGTVAQYVVEPGQFGTGVLLRDNMEVPELEIDKYAPTITYDQYENEIILHYSYDDPSSFTYGFPDYDRTMTLLKKEEMPDDIPVPNNQTIERYIGHYFLYEAEEGMFFLLPVSRK